MLLFDNLHFEFTFNKKKNVLEKLHNIEYAYSPAVRGTALLAHH